MVKTKVGTAFKIKHGLAISGTDMVANQPSDCELPVVTAIGDFDYSGGYGYRVKKSKHLKSTAPSLYVLKPGQILLAMTCQTAGGEILGIPGKVPDDDREYVHNQRIGLVEILDDSIIDIDYFYHWMKTSNVRQQLTATATGTKILHTSPSRIEDLDFSGPDIATQRSVASLLSSLDNKIEANAKLASDADELAQAIFRQTARSAIRVSTFETVANVSGGGTPKTSVDDYWGGNISWATPTDITALNHPYLFRTSRTLTDEGLANCASALYPAGTILMTSRATIGAFALAQVPTAVNQGFITVQAKDPALQAWLYLDMRSRTEEFRSWANGATFLELSRGNFKRLPVGLPDIETLTSFNSSTKDLFDLAVSHVKENQHLTELRDYLLPRLMSGKIKVRAADNYVEAAL